MPPTSDSERATTPCRTGAPPQSRPTSYRDSTLSVFVLLLAFRIVNAWTLRTFFQPDEYFQSLEPAWQLAFGPSSNAWITWVNAPTLSAARPNLTIFSGVENAIALLSASSLLWGRLYTCGTSHTPLWLDYPRQGPCPACCAEGYPSRLRSTTGLLHMETCRKSVRPRHAQRFRYRTSQAHSCIFSISDI